MIGLCTFAGLLSNLRTHSAPARPARVAAAVLRSDPMMFSRSLAFRKCLRSAVFVGAAVCAFETNRAHAQSGDSISPLSNVTGPADSTPSADYVRNGKPSRRGSIPTAPRRRPPVPKPRARRRNRRPQPGTGPRRPGPRNQSPQPVTGPRRPGPRNHSPRPMTGPRRPGPRNHGLRHHGPRRPGPRDLARDRRPARDDWASAYAAPAHRGRNHAVAAASGRRRYR